MGDYLVSVVVMTAIVGFITYISYPGASERAMKVVSAILLIYTVAHPAVSLVKEISGGDFLSAIYDADLSDTDMGNDTYIEITENAFREGIKKEISSKYSISEENIEVHVFDIDFESMTAGKIKIILKGKAALADWRGMEQYINSLKLGRCEVIADLER